MKKEKLIEQLESHPEFKKDLFIRGFLITNYEELELSEFPFYGNWKIKKHGEYSFVAHKLTGMHIFERDNNVFFIMGHAYNPFTMEHDEINILEFVSEFYGTPEYIEKINDLTGVFVMGNIINGKIEFLVDPSGMQSACYGEVDGKFYISSHPQLIGDICNLEMDGFINELINYKWYGRVMGPYLPADLTPFLVLKRIVPSIKYQYDGVLKHKRYWPLKDIDEIKNENEYIEVIEKAASILRNNMILVAKKWNNPWISMTGGIDSNTTFASAVGLYQDFETFSYISAEKELPDAKAAKEIADHFDIEHHEFYIPNQNKDLQNFYLIREILRHNNGYIAELKDNEARKRIYLRENAHCDVEVKSWVSETIRAYWYKHYGRKNMPKLSAKLFRNLYKIFIFNRKIAKSIDAIFADYIEKYEYKNIPNGYPPADMHYNEVTWGSWGGLNISEMKYCFDITFIYNNRRFLDLMFKVPLKKRINDEHHLAMKKYLNRELYDLNIRVVNMHETKFRAFALNIIFTINSILPF